MIEREAMFTVTEILSATGGRLIRGDPAGVVQGVSIDSRTIRPGELFIAIKGERFDGHRFIYEALKRGGCGVLVNVSGHRIPETVQEEAHLRDTILMGVTDTVEALQDLSRFHRQRWALPVVAVTGSNGKTTTKEMAAAILTERYVTLKSGGNVNNQIGVPLTLLRLAAHHQVAVLEMGVSRPGELRRLVKMAVPRIGLVTNIGPTHLETLGNLEGVARAKAEVLEGLPPSEGVAILNRDDSFYPYLNARTSGRVVTFGSGPETDVCIEGIEESGSHVILHLTYQGSVFGIGLPHARSGHGSGRSPQIRIKLPLIGRYNAMNAAAAAAIGLVMGCDLEEIRRGLEQFRPIAMRLELIPWEDRTILNDAYNANPASMQAALETLSRFPGKGRRVAVLGDMLELGAAEVEAHRQVGRLVVLSKTAFLITMGTHAERMAEAALAEGMDRDHVTICRDPSEVAQVLRRVAGSGDVILIKGSRGMRMERILDELGLKR